MEQVAINVAKVNWRDVKQGDVIFLSADQLGQLNVSGSLVPNFPYVVCGDYRYGFDINYSEAGEDGEKDLLGELKFRDLSTGLHSVYIAVSGGANTTPVKPIEAVLPDVTTASLDTLVSIVTDYPLVVEWATAELSTRLSPILSGLTRNKKVVE